MIGKPADSSMLLVPKRIVIHTSANISIAALGTLVMFTIQGPVQVGQVNPQLKQRCCQVWWGRNPQGRK